MWVPNVSDLPAGGRCLAYTLRDQPPLVYHPEYSADPWPAAHRFVMSKFRDLHADLLARPPPGSPLAFLQPQPLPASALSLVHDAAYVQRVLTSTLSPAEVRRIGFAGLWTPVVARRTALEVAGTALAARLALRHGLGCNLAGGTHHAVPAAGSGFCVLNDLAVTAAHLLAEGAVRKVLILDLDVHQGDGTAAIFGADHSGVFTCSVHCEKNFPARKQTSSLDIGLPPGVADEEYLSLVHRLLPLLLDCFSPDLVLYDAGCDVHADDTLGFLNISDAGLWERDVYVLGQCVGRRVPVATVIGGGYSPDPAVLARRHSTIVRAAVHVWQTLRGPPRRSSGPKAPSSLPAP